MSCKPWLRLDWYFSPSGSTFSLNSSSVKCACGIVVPSATTMSSLRFLVAAVTGSPIAGDVKVDLCADSGSGTPGSVLETKYASSAPSASGWLDVTGFTTALSAATQYWLVISNANAAPASNYWQVSYTNVSSDALTIGQFGPLYGFAFRSNTGASWANYFGGQVLTCRVGFGSGSYCGFPIWNPQHANVYGTNYIGNRFTMPFSARITAIFAEIYALFSPTGGLVAKIYTGASSTPSLAATSNLIPVGQMDASYGRFGAFFFSTPLLVTAGTDVRVVVAAQGTSDSTNRFATDYNVIDSDANSLLTIPYGARYTSTSDGTTFSEDNTKLATMGVLIDPSSGPANGGLIVHPGMAGGMRG